jgi:hypothetical protein
MRAEDVPSTEELPRVGYVVGGGLAVLFTAGVLILNGMGITGLATLSALVPMAAIVLLGGVFLARLSLPSTTDINNLKAENAQLKIENSELRHRNFTLEMNTHRATAESNARLVDTTHDLALVLEELKQTPRFLTREEISDLWDQTGAKFTLDKKSFMDSIRRQRRLLQVLAEHGVGLAFKERGAYDVATRDSNSLDSMDDLGTTGDDSGDPPRSEDLVDLLVSTSVVSTVVHESIGETINATSHDSRDPA